MFCLMLPGSVGIQVVKGNSNIPQAEGSVFIRGKAEVKDFS